MSVIEELAGGGGDVGGKQKQVGLRADYDIQPGGEIRSLEELEERERRYMRALKEAQQDDGRRLVYAKRDGDDTRSRTEQKRTARSTGAGANNYTLETKNARGTRTRSGP